MAVKSASPRVKVFGAEPAALPRYTASLSVGRPVMVEKRRTVADALVSQIPGSVCFPYVAANTDGMADVDEAFILSGMKLLLTEGKLLETGKDFFSVIEALAKALCKEACNFITIIHGEGADEAQADKVREIFQNSAGDAEINVLCGGQPVYSYLISVE